MDTLLRISDVIRIVGMGKSSVYAAMARNEFPKPVSLGLGRSVRWKNSDIQEFVSTRPPARII